MPGGTHIISGYGSINLAGTSVSHAVKAGIRINTDGTIDKREGASYTQLAANTDWIIPNLKAGKRTIHVNLLGTDTFMHGDTMNSYLELSAAKEWYHDSSGLNRATTLKISVDAGTSDEDTGVYNISVP